MGKMDEISNHAINRRTEDAEDVRKGVKKDMKTLLKRLEELEERYKPDAPLVVLAELDSGDQVEMTMRECLERDDAHFVKCIGGRSLTDLDAFLEEVRRKAFENAEEVEV